MEAAQKFPRRLIKLLRESQAPLKIMNKHAYAPFQKTSKFVFLSYFTIYNIPNPLYIPGRETTAVILLPLDPEGGGKVANCT